MKSQKNKFSVILPLLLLAGCSSDVGYINVNQIEPAVMIITNRHDEYVRKDTSKSDLDKASELRTSQLLRDVITEAKKVPK